ncbi:MAG: (deoxy)nucleoside triphosphate pyrophosphohydrolase [Myxococcales bacterium]
MPPLHVVGAAITQGHQCLIAQRGPHGSLAGKWEFPGGKVEPGESPTAALAREIAEELGFEISVGQFLANGTAMVGTRVISLDVYAASITAGGVVLREHAQIAWVSADELPSYDWAEADIPCLAPVAAWLRTLQVDRGS